MKLTRHQADLVLRHYTAEYAKEVSSDLNFWQEPEFATFVRELQWRINADLTRDLIKWLVKAWQAFFQDRASDDVINFEVNEILNAAGYRGPHILR